MGKLEKLKGYKRNSACLFEDYLLQKPQHVEICFLDIKRGAFLISPLIRVTENLVWMQATLADSFLADLEDLSDNEVLDEVSHCVIILTEDSPGLGFRV
jgi:surface polysaccharide O-acyltransferase-like enzyme